MSASPLDHPPADHDVVGADGEASSAGAGQESDTNPVTPASDPQSAGAKTDIESPVPVTQSATDAAATPKLKGDTHMPLLTLDKDDHLTVGTWRNSQPVTNVVARVTKNTTLTFHHGDETLSFNEVFHGDNVVLTVALDAVKQDLESTTKEEAVDESKANSNVERLRHHMQPLLLYMIGQSRDEPTGMQHIAKSSVPFLEKALRAIQVVYVDELKLLPVPRDGFDPLPMHDHSKGSVTQTREFRNAYMHLEVQFDPKHFPIMYWPQLKMTLEEWEEYLTFTASSREKAIWSPWEWEIAIRTKSALLYFGIKLANNNDIQDFVELQHALAVNREFPLGIFYVHDEERFESSPLYAVEEESASGKKMDTDGDISDVLDDDENRHESHRDDAGYKNKRGFYDTSMSYLLPSRIADYVNRHGMEATGKSNSDCSLSAHTSMPVPESAALIYRIEVLRAINEEITPRQLRVKPASSPVLSIRSTSPTL
ncbi:hypothetical protein HBH51_199040 [Parastagonospora nodorum]|nr:hypothetical protein HBH51_199040 [Parastagonospora nodorum]